MFKGLIEIALKMCNNLLKPEKRRLLITYCICQYKNEKTELRAQTRIKLHQSYALRGCWNITKYDSMLILKTQSRV